MLKKALAVLLVLVAITDAAAITIDTVPVGDPGNANDPRTGNPYGGVNYDYRIGTTEVTVGQYTAFLNSVAATDTYALYNPLMETVPDTAGIARNGSPGSYNYSVIGSPNKPVTFVNWGDAARFTNWLNNGQPTGGQNASTTEGGSYTLNGAVSLQALSAVNRNAGATWFIPTENEWYKAAYYQPAAQGGDVDGYWAYATRTNNTPYSDQPPGSSSPTESNTANFYSDDGIANGYNDGFAVTGSPIYTSGLNYLTDVGAYTQSRSFYGTFDQTGNVSELNGTYIGGGLRGRRGGNWILESNVLNNRYATPVTFEDAHGFRVAALATVPEPSSLVLAALGLIGFSAWGWRRKRRGA